MRKRYLALVTLMVMLASMVLPCAAMAANPNTFYACVMTKVHDKDVYLPFEYQTGFYFGGGGSDNSWIGKCYVEDSAWNMANVRQSGEYTYYLLNDGTAALIAMDQGYQSKTITIPETIDGYVITRLGLDTNVGINLPDKDIPLLFSTRVEEVILPDTIHTIGLSALQVGYYDSVGKLTAPGVTAIGGLCDLNVKCKLPENLENIGMFAFYGANLTICKNKLTLPETLVKIGACAFMDSALKSVTIPGSVQEIGPYTFAGCAWRLQTVTLKNGVPYISDGMFMNCKKLKQISLPESIASVGAYAFENCEKLSKVTFAKKAQVASIGEGAFRGCAALKNVVIPEGVTEIGDVAFFDCSALSAVTLPDSLTSIGAHAFDGCSSKVKFTVVDGSYAHKWATDNGFATKVQKRK